MTDQRTSTDEPVPAEQHSTETPAPTTETKATKPMDMRDLRDVQTERDQKDTDERSDRPAIRAEGAKPAGAKRSSAPSEAAVPSEAPLFKEAAGRELRKRWLVIQTEFVDEPRTAVQKADSLVAEVLESLTDTFARERESLEAGWSDKGGDSGADVTTEDLRQVIRRYRSFFNRLLSF